MHSPRPDGIQCARCEKLNALGAKFCNRCGSPLVRAQSLHDQYQARIENRLMEAMAFPGWGEVNALNKLDIDQELRQKKYFTGASRTRLLRQSQTVGFQVRLEAIQYAHTPGKPYHHWYNQVLLTCEEDMSGGFKSETIERLQQIAVQYARRAALQRANEPSTVTSVVLALVADRLSAPGKQIEKFFVDSLERTANYEVLNVAIALQERKAFATRHTSHPWHEPGLKKFFDPSFLNRD